MTNYKHINTDYFEDFGSMDDAFIVEMIDIFLEDSIVFMDELNTAIANNNQQEIKATAHKFKSSAKVFGMDVLHEFLVAVENGEKDVLSNAFKEELVNFQLNYEAAIKELKTLKSTL